MTQLLGGAPPVTSALPPAAQRSRRATAQLLALALEKVLPGRFDRELLTEALCGDYSAPVWSALAEHPVIGFGVSVLGAMTSSPFQGVEAPVAPPGEGAPVTVAVHEVDGVENVRG